MTTFLFCDDHPVVVEGLRNLFSKNPDFQALDVVARVKEIIPTIHRLRPDVLFLDLSMDEKNMVEQIAELKKLRPTMRIIVFTSYNLPALVSRAFAEGADAYLLKSSSWLEMQAAVSSVCAHQKFVGSDVRLRNTERRKILGVSTAPVDRFEALQQLTGKEKEIYHLVVEGKTEQEIADKLFISKHTVHTHRKNLMAKLGLHSSSDFVRFSAQ